MKFLSLIVRNALRNTHAAEHASIVFHLEKGQFLEGRINATAQGR